jgi:hypothetical protein
MLKFHRFIISDAMPNTIEFHSVQFSIKFYFILLII